jgi:MraZ protein
MALLSGEYSATLDEKGRISIPSKFREGIPENVLILSKGIEHCIWAHTPQVWERVSARFQNMPLSMRKATMVEHRFVFATQEAEIDKAGRIAVPQKLRDFAGLTKECIVASNGTRIEIWDAERYAAYEQASDEQLMDVFEEMGPLNLY